MCERAAFIECPYCGGEGRGDDGWYGWVCRECDGTGSYEIEVVLIDEDDLEDAFG